jgi:hypothetical protein
MGPVSAKTYVGRRWAPKGEIPQLAPDYGRRAYQWVFGAFEPKSGLAHTYCSDRRRSQDFITFLDQVLRVWPREDLVLILDNLSIHKSMSVKLWALAHQRVRFLFQPTYAPWLNLIEPWWKTLRSIALACCRFEDA